MGFEKQALLTILHFYDQAYDYDAFMRILPLTPFVVRCDFVAQELISILKLGKPS